MHDVRDIGSDPRGGAATPGSIRRKLDRAFKALTGFDPMSWQRRLYLDHIGKGDIPSSVDVPTGLGKTAAMALWLIARAFTKADALPHLPRRLVYVVDRRAVVDQATAEAERLREALEAKGEHFLRMSGADRAEALAAVAELKGGLGLEGRPLPISTLRGQHVDNRDWLADPAAPAIVVGTVDMIGSRLLFQGYGVSRGMRPRHAGLLGVDALVVLDEAHLVPPFTHLLRAVEEEASLWPKALKDRALLPRFRMMALSATQREDGVCERRPFRFGEGADDLDEVAGLRINSSKTLHIERLRVDEKDHDRRLAEKALALAKDGPARVVVFCDRRSKTKEGPSAEGVARAIVEGAKSDKIPIVEPALLVGGRRVREREQALETLKKLGFISGEGRSEKPTFLICTAAGEVGVDIDADHMVSDLVPWDRMVQRLGRVNRRGEKDRAAQIVVFSASSLEKAEPPTPRSLTCGLLESLARADDRSVNPAALRRLEQAKPDAIRAASTPAPLRPALNRALVDAWAMTSLEEHTGRPEVGPWLRGWVEEELQTTLLWRRHLPWPQGAPPPDGDTIPTRIKRDVRRFFEIGGVHLVETVEVRASRAAEALRIRAKKALEAWATAPGEKRQGMLEPGAPALLILSGAGELQRALSVEALAGIKADFLFRLVVERSVVIDARLGGLSTEGLLDGAVAAPATTLDGETPFAVEGDDAPADQRRADEAIGVRIVLERSGSRYTDDHPAWRRAYAFVRRPGDDSDGGPEEAIVVYVARREPGETEGDPAISRCAQSLADHHAWTERCATGTARRLSLPDELARVLAVAARLHDAGKRRRIWQDAMGAPRDGRPYAKTDGKRTNTDLMARYRHEFGSLAHVDEDAEYRALPKDLQDLVLHIVAAHHGHARPVIRAIDPDWPDSLLQARARDAALRFARLQRRWGPWGLAWWEALLRAADAQASRENDEREGH